MNLKILLLALNWMGIALAVIFCFLQILLPEGYRAPYMYLLVGVAICSAGPFLINYKWLRGASVPDKMSSYIGLFLLLLLVTVDAFCLGLIYSDQLEVSSGFGFLLSLSIYFVLFFPVWGAFLICFKSKRATDPNKKLQK